MSYISQKPFLSRSFKLFLAGAVLWILLWTEATYLATSAALAITLCFGPFVSIAIWIGSVLGLYAKFSILDSIIGATLLAFAALASVSIISFYTKKLRFATLGDILTFFLSAIVFSLILSIYPQYFFSSNNFESAFIVTLACVSSFSPLLI
ncbi:MAG: hypothetical protein GX780_01800, partial [Campylobacteraceae bacterium]|nr:hypothetical protein [Campylobacteraceae bacterium]